MKKIFTLNLDGLTMIPSEEAAKMIGGKGNNNGGASLWTPNIPIITIDFNSGTTGCLNGLTGSGKKDKNGNVTLNTNYAIGNGTTIIGTVSGGNGKINSYGIGVQQQLGDTTVTGKVTNNGPTVGISQKIGNFTGSGNVNINSNGRLDNASFGVKYQNGSTSAKVEVGTNGSGSFTTTIGF